MSDFFHYTIPHFPQQTLILLQPSKIKNSLCVCIWKNTHLYVFYCLLWGISLFKKVIIHSWLPLDCDVMKDSPPLLLICFPPPINLQ